VTRGRSEEKVPTRVLESQSKIELSDDWRIIFEDGQHILRAVETRVAG
jgi:hypothetical protein